MLNLERRQAIYKVISVNQDLQAIYKVISVNQDLQAIYKVISVNQGLLLLNYRSNSGGN